MASKYSFSSSEFWSIWRLSVFSLWSWICMESLGVLLPHRLQVKSSYEQRFTPPSPVLSLGSPDSPHETQLSQGVIPHLHSDIKQKPLTKPPRTRLVDISPTEWGVCKINVWAVIDSSPHDHGVICHLAIILCNSAQMSAYLRLLKQWAIMVHQRWFFRKSISW